MKTKPNQALAGSKAAFLEEVAVCWPIAKGSLTHTRSPCTRPNCRACAAGRKHLRWLFTFRESGRLKGLYVRPAHAPQVRRAIENGRQLERLLAAAGRELVLALREEQDA